MRAICLALALLVPTAVSAQEPPEISLFEARVLEQFASTVRIEILLETRQAFTPNPEPVEIHNAAGAPNPFVFSSLEQVTQAIQPAAVLRLGRGDLSWTLNRAIQTTSTTYQLTTVSPPGTALPFSGTEFQTEETGSDSSSCFVSAAGPPAVTDADGAIFASEVEVPLVDSTTEGSVAIALYSVELVHPAPRWPVTLSIGTVDLDTAAGGCAGAGGFTQEIRTSPVTGLVDWDGSAPQNVIVQTRGEPVVETHDLATDFVSIEPPVPAPVITVELHGLNPVAVPGLSTVGLAVLIGLIAGVALRRLG